MQVVATSDVSSTFSSHCNKWNTCTACALSTKRRVYYSGCLPCDILYVTGEPNDGDQALRCPTISGQRSKLMAELRHLVDRWFTWNSTFSLKQGVTVSVACAPEDGVTVSTACVASCAPRLVELAELAKPSLIVLMGNHPATQSTYLSNHTCRITKSLDWMLKQRDPYLEVKKVALLVAPVLFSIMEKNHVNSKSK